MIMNVGLEINMMRQQITQVREINGRTRYILAL